jgi:hypothetical protein
MGGTGVRLAVEWSGRFVGTCSLVFLHFFFFHVRPCGLPRLGASWER